MLVWRIQLCVAKFGGDTGYPSVLIDLRGECLMLGWRTQLCVAKLSGDTGYPSVLIDLWMRMHVGLENAIMSCKKMLLCITKSDAAILFSLK